MDAALKKQIADELEVEVDDLQSDTVLRDLEYWDSVMALTVMTLIDMALGKPVSPDEFSEVITFGDIEKLVAKMAGGN
ncbi:MAG: acyl carrier protein [Alphaproteobacteria bacterium]